jgi:fatty acid desaturase
MTDRELARRIRGELSPEAFCTNPMRLLLAALLLAAILGLSTCLATLPLPVYAAIPISLLLGNLYVSLFFFGHEVGHGAVSRVRAVQTLVMYFSFAIFFLSPHFWRVWHNRVHHGYTNRPGYDPDNFGDMESYERYPSTNFLLKVGPGSGHWLSVIYFPTWFTMLSQGVLWIKSRRLAGFAPLSRVRAGADSALMAAMWIALGVWLGGYRSLITILIPMMTANAVAMSYISTNHLLRPQVDHSDALASSMSVTTYRWLDRLQFHFSHHVEHHLLPAMNSSYAPRAREVLQRLAGTHYLAPRHWQALVLLFRTPRVQDGNRALVDPRRRLQVMYDDIEAALRRGDTRVPVLPFDATAPLETAVS